MSRTRAAARAQCRPRTIRGPVYRKPHLRGKNTSLGLQLLRILLHQAIHVQLRLRRELCVARRVDEIEADTCVRADEQYVVYDTEGELHLLVHTELVQTEDAERPDGLGRQGRRDARGEPGELHADAAEDAPEDLVGASVGTHTAAGKNLNAHRAMRAAV